MLFNNMAYLPVKSGRQPNIERLLCALYSNNCYDINFYRSIYINSLSI